MFESALPSLYGTPNLEKRWVDTTSPKFANLVSDGLTKGGKEKNGSLKQGPKGAH